MSNVKKKFEGKKSPYNSRQRVNCKYSKESMVFFIVECRKRVNGRANPLPMSLAERRGEEERREEMCPI